MQYLLRFYQQNLKIMTKPFTVFLWMGWLWSWGSMGRIAAEIALESWLFGFRPCSGQGHFTLDLIFQKSLLWPVQEDAEAMQSVHWFRTKLKHTNIIRTATQTADLAQAFFFTRLIDDSTDRPTTSSGKGRLSCLCLGLVWQLVTPCSCSDVRINYKTSEKVLTAAI